MSKSCAVRLYSGGLPAVTTIHPSGTRWRPKILYCKNCSIAGVSVSDTQLISSRNRMPSRLPVASIASYTAAMISLIVYSDTSYSTPSYVFFAMNGKPSALWRVWCVIEYDTNPTSRSWAICSMMAVFPMPGAPSRNTGRCRSVGRR